MSGYKGKRATVAERLDSRSIPEPNSGCILWLGSMLPAGYGQVTVEGANGEWVNKYAHRVAYEHFVGPIPEGLTIDHLCRNTSCINPGHLEPVTLRENLLRGNCMGARYARRTACDRGHEFTPANTYVRRNGRACRICLREKDRARYWSKVHVATRPNGDPEEGCS